MLLDIDKIRTALVLMPDKHLGNFVVSLSAIDALIKYFQNQTCYLVIDNNYREIIEDLHEPERTFYYPSNELYESTLPKRILLYFRFINELRSIHPDAVIDLQGGNASSIMTFLSGAPYRVSNSFAKRSYIYNIKINLSSGNHKVYSYTEIATAIGATIPDTYFRLQASADRRTSINHILKLHGITVDKPIVSIHVGAGKIDRQWTTEGFAAVADWLSAKGFQVVFVGAASDMAKIDGVMSLLSHNSYNLGNTLSLGDLMALFEMSSFFLGNDSGPMHLAAAMGTPIVALFGSEYESRWHPLSANSIALRGQEPCLDCKRIRNNCQHYECITRLSAATVKQAIDQLLESDARDRAHSEGSRSIGSNHIDDI
ncbi:MAG: glycosyltransferase family 9 protein [Syntrophobacterales bacterium]|jgi:heptosyltransferase-3